MLKTTNIEADMMREAKRREYDRQMEWEEEYSRRRDMDYLQVGYTMLLAVSFPNALFFNSLKKDIYI